MRISIGCTKKMYRIEVTFPREAEEYIGLQCNNEKEVFSKLPEIEEIRLYLRDLNPNVVLDVGSGIGRASVYFFKHFRWTDTRFILADGDSGKTQLSGIRTGEGEYYNSLDATRAFCEANGLYNFETFNLGKHKWGELNCRPDLAYSFMALGFHWPVNSFLDDVHDSLEDKCLLIFGLRGGERARGWIGQQIREINRKEYRVVEISFEPKKKRGGFMVLEKI